MTSYPPKQGEAFSFPANLYNHLGDIVTNPTIAAGDLKISIDYGAFANLTTLPDVDPDVTNQVKVSLSAAEMNGTVIHVVAIDQTTPKEWKDAEWTFYTIIGTTLTNITAPVLADYLSLNFSSIKTQLSWSDSIEVTAVINKTFEMYGVATEAEATDLTKLHALADVAVWRQALNDISLDYAFSADGASFSRNQAVDAIRKNLDNAESLAIAYLPAYNITVHNYDNHPDWTA
jgi:hypothetical protein